MSTQKIIILIILFLLLVRLFINNIKFKHQVNQGEEDVNKLLSKLKDTILLNDIMIKSGNGTSQIDHILISKKGVFVIETKDYNGEIYGEEYSKYWVQVINKNKNKFYSPIRQNYGHIKALEECLKMKYIFISIIIFTNKSKLKKVKTKTPVIQLNQLKIFLKNHKSNINLSKNEMEYIYKLIKKSNIQSNRRRKKHIKIISKKIS